LSLCRDDEADGAWEAPQIDNPEYKGEWRAKRIANPAYKGAWVHPEIANPDYVEDPNLHSFAKIGYVGIELWQVKAGTIFDNIIVTDDIVEAENLMAETYTKNIALEKKMLEDADKAAADKAAADRAAAEASKPAEPEAKEEEAEEAKEENVHDEL
jgi:calreticulin